MKYHIVIHNGEGIVGEKKFAKNYFKEFRAQSSPLFPVHCIL